MTIRPIKLSCDRVREAGPTAVFCAAAMLSPGLIDDFAHRLRRFVPKEQESERRQERQRSCGRHAHARQIDRHRDGEYCEYQTAQAIILMRWSCMTKAYANCGCSYCSKRHVHDGWTDLTCTGNPRARGGGCSRDGRCRTCRSHLRAPRIRSLRTRGLVET